jgi:alpha-glucosidase (family GH31 glycosyl hydrolase)
MRPAPPAALALAALCAACSSSSSPAPNPAPIHPPSATLGRFALAGGLESSKLAIASPDGRLLLEGLGNGGVVEGSPHAGFAVRDVAETDTMLTGAFKHEETARGPWRLATKLDWSLDGGTLTLTPLDAAGARLARLRVTSPSEGHLRVDVERGDGPEARFSWGFRCEPSDHFLGFGAQTWDVDHRGQNVPIWVQEQGIGKAQTDEYIGLWQLQGRRHSSYYPMPEYLSSRGYVLVAQSDLRSVFSMCAEPDHPEVARVQIEMPASIHLFDGPEPKRAIERATGAFGRPRLPPRLAFAPWNDAIFGSDNVRRVANKLRERRVPSSVIWTEDWRGGGFKPDGTSYALAEEWEVDRNLYPDFEQLAADLHNSGFALLVYFNSFVYVESKAWNETAPNGWLVKKADGSPYVFEGAKLTKTGLLDLSNPAARAWAISKLRAAIALGADGWMGDYAEWLPTDSVTWAGPGREQHNLYPVLWQRAQREALDSVGDGIPRLFFARSGWFGTPELADVLWAGDQRTDFQADDGLPTIVPMGIGLGVGGISTYGHDIAGYQSATNAPASKELFLRWTELGAFTPVMRTHHGYQPKKNWNWESDDETVEHFARYARIHIALAPLWEGLAREASATGVPIWRGLPLEFPADSAVWPIKDEVLIGAGILVAPVTTQGASSRSVYLPAGRWYPWEGGAAIEGPVRRDVAAPLGEIPVFARAGTLVPMFPDGVMTLAAGTPEVPGPELVGDSRVVRVFLGASGRFEEASGLRYDLEHAGDAPAPSPVSLAWQGAALGPCDPARTPPCVSEESPGREVARVVGPGVLEVRASGGAPAARVTATGGAASRVLAFDVRR